MDKKISVFISEEKIQARVKELGAQIAHDYQGKSLHLLCLLKGSFIFCADLCRHIDLPLEVSFLSLSSYGNETSSSGQVNFLSEIPKELEGKDVLIVEDIVDSGFTIAKLREKLQKFPLKSLRLCTLLFKPTQLKHPVSIEYVGFSIEDKFVVGYGLDLAQNYRQLPFVGLVEQ
ncbi:MAG: hypoxanthine phosphoribosyltransferase [Bacteriovoracaceae bacterium]|nr:hypoxanthine phosphoribosyltransferase [Bacteriovoracaceae bacterium]